ncbi:hypothetical protein [Pseudobutyrivibrio ruminis]|uniref:hypothetical protein n=1 Tax=Pseudobutyrivibrio ruminis TaxID=46206 RepID=UPI00166F9CB6|nr:hypothetical protein [Pseudobutyrivibrio ruminis]
MDSDRVPENYTEIIVSDELKEKFQNIRRKKELAVKAFMLWILIREFNENSFEIECAEACEQMQENYEQQQQMFNLLDFFTYGMTPFEVPAPVL